MKRYIGMLFVIAGILGGLYVGGWVMFIKPIIDICKAFDTGMLTGLMVGHTVLKCMFAGAVGGIIYFIGVVIGYIFLQD